MAKQRISYVPLEKMDADMRKEMERCQREGTPRPESTAVRATVCAGGCRSDAPSGNALLASSGWRLG